MTKSHCRQTYGFICTATLYGITGGDWGFRVGTGVGGGFPSDKITLWTNIWLYMYSHPLGYNWGVQSDKITLWTNIWLYMYSHPLGYNWGGLGF